MCRKITAPRARFLSRQLAQRLHICSKALEFRIDDRIGSIRCHDATFPAAGANPGVMRERVKRRFRGRDHFDVELLE